MDKVRVYCKDSEVIQKLGGYRKQLLAVSSPHALKGKQERVEFWDGVIMHQARFFLHQVIEKPLLSRITKVKD